jgi:hypothetical protein
MTKSPAIGSSGVVMKPQQDGQLYFHSDLPQDPDDETIMDEAERRRRERDRKSGATRKKSRRGRSRSGTNTSLYTPL